MKTELLGCVSKIVLNIILSMIILSVIYHFTNENPSTLTMIGNFVVVTICSIFFERKELKKALGIKDE